MSIESGTKVLTELGPTRGTAGVCDWETRRPIGLLAEARADVLTQPIGPLRSDPCAHRQTRFIRRVVAEIGPGRRTVRRYLNAPEWPQPKPKGKRNSTLGSFREHLLARWARGCHNVAASYREILQLGYAGS